VPSPSVLVPLSWVLQEEETPTPVYPRLAGVDARPKETEGSCSRLLHFLSKKANLKQGFSLELCICDLIRVPKLMPNQTMSDEPKS